MGILPHLKSDSISAVLQQLGADLQGPLAHPRIVRGEPEPQHLGQSSSVCQGASFPSRHPSPFPSLPGTFPEGLPCGTAPLSSDAPAPTQELFPAASSLLQPARGCLLAFPPAGPTSLPPRAHSHLAWQQEVPAPLLIPQGPQNSQGPHWWQEGCFPHHPMDTHLGDVYEVDRARLCLEHDCHEPAQSLRGHVQRLKAEERDGDAGSRLLPAHSLCWGGVLTERWAGKGQQVTWSCSTASSAFPISPVCSAAEGSGRMARQQSDSRLQISLLLKEISSLLARGNKKRGVPSALQRGSHGIWACPPRRPQIQPA